MKPYFDTNHLAPHRRIATDSIRASPLPACLPPGPTGLLIHAAPGALGIA
jgi:hypothetical protein